MNSWVQDWALGGIFIMYLAYSKNVPSLYKQLQGELLVSLHDGDTNYSKN